jgi:hypothetical protein
LGASSRTFAKQATLLDSYLGTDRLLDLVQGLLELIAPAGGCFQDFENVFSLI